MSPEAGDFWDRALRALESAKALASSDPDGSASRAYYAAFYAVSALFALEGKTFTRHSAVMTAVHRDLVNTGTWPADIGKSYSLLFELRSTADYGGAVHISREDCEKALMSAELIIQAVREKHSDLFGSRPGTMKG